MGTRSLTVFVEDKKEIVVMYRQFDGYPEGHGKDLATFLTGMKLVNGLPCGDDAIKARLANGISCLAAQVIANFKTEPGGIYLEPAKTRDCGEEYIYTITGKCGKEPEINVFDVYKDKTLYNGPASKVLAEIERDDT